MTLQSLKQWTLEQNSSLLSVTPKIRPYGLHCRPTWCDSGLVAAGGMYQPRIACWSPHTSKYFVSLNCKQAAFSCQSMFSYSIAEQSAIRAACLVTWPLYIGHCRRPPAMHRQWFGDVPCRAGHESLQDARDMSMRALTFEVVYGLYMVVCKPPPP